MQNTLAFQGGASGDCVATATAKEDLAGADLILPFGVSPLVNGSNAELELLLPEYRGKQNAGNISILLVVVLVVMLVVVLMVLLSVPSVIVLVIFGLRKKPARSSEDWCMLLPLNPQGLLRDSPRK